MIMNAALTAIMTTITAIEINHLAGVQLRLRLRP
jgi:hypothetical protein